MEEYGKWYNSWVVIIIALFLFWPIGLVLLCMKFVPKSGKRVSKSVILWIVAIFFYLAALGGLMAMTTSFEASNVIMFIVCLAIAIACTIPAIKERKKYKHYNEYIDLLMVRRKMSIEEIAEKTGDTIEQVNENISKIIQYKLLNAYINDENEVVLMSNNNNTYATSSYVETKRQVSTVKCKNCGATNKYIEGKENICEYCGTIINNK